MKYDELSQDMKTYLDNNPLAKQQFDLIGTQGEQAISKWLMDAEKYAVEYKKQRDFTAGQVENQKQQASITQNQNIRGAKDTLAK